GASATNQLISSSLPAPVSRFRLPIHLRGSGNRKQPAISFLQIHQLSLKQVHQLSWPLIAWLLDASDHLAARLARHGDPEPIEIEDTETTFSIGWKGQYRVEGAAFIYTDWGTKRTTAILGYPTHKLAATA